MTMPAQPTIEDILDLLAVIAQDLNALREKIDDDIGRRAVASQTTAITNLWRKIDAQRLAQPVGLDKAVAGLKAISTELKKEKKKILTVAKVIEGAARVIAIAEKVRGLIPL